MYRGVNEENSPQCLLYEYECIVMHPEAEFLDVIRNWDKSLKSFPPCFSQAPLLQILFLGGVRWFETGL
jgi:hypothetical protein